ALGAAFELCSERVPELAREIADWEEGRRITIGVHPSGPYVSIEKRGQRIACMGPVKAEHPDLQIRFKNLESALLIFTAQMGGHDAVVECRVGVTGDNAMAMQMNRAMAIVQAYLFPAILHHRLFKRAPRMTTAQLAVKAQIMGLLAPRLFFVVGRK
ncbi:MAG: hypothetical protein WC889_06005, partial [Myxococcota bacterium]